VFRRLHSFVGFLPILAATLLLAWSMIAAVREKVGHAAPTLDDAYIHYQYARAIAEGHPLRFFEDAPRSSGATSLLWPLLLAPFWLLGLRGADLTWGAWILGFSALAGLAYESQKLTEKLTSRAMGWAAALGVLSFGGLSWCAASGMEVVPFAWAIARSLRLASEWSEVQASERTPSRFRGLVLITFAMALLRPEGQAYALLVALVVLVFPARATLRSRARALIPAAAAIATPLFLFLLTGTAKSSTAEVKLILGNPYYSFVDASVANARLLVGTLLNGEGWTPEFLPKGVAPIALGGLTAILVCGARKKAFVRSALVLAFALGMFIPCTYITFLWNRLRYLWPFAPGFIMGAMCLAHLAGELAARLRARYAALSLVCAGAVIGGLATHFSWVREDVAQSASGIDRQQATLGRWAKANLPRDARIGVNDTGAIAYFSERRTFDIVGLTTPSEARYWVGGAASRVEHYERLLQTAPNRLPNFFIVYPEWMGTEAVLGPALHEAVVTDSSILGGQIMRVYVANYALLGSGEKPWTDVGTVIDNVDVADLESEHDHGYELLFARDGEEVVVDSSAPDGHPVLDGGRTHRTRERFFVNLSAGVASSGVVRVRGDATVSASIYVQGERVADIAFEDSQWIEAPFPIREKLASPHTLIELRTNDGATVDVFHYFFGSK
jgi:hypothetical protein